MGAVDSRTDPDLRDVTDNRDGTAARGLAHRLERLAASHPSSPDYSDRRSPPDQIHPLSDAEHTQHVAEVRERLADAKAAELDTKFQHTIDPEHEFWSADREAAHDALLADIYERAASVPCDHKAVVAGGLAGAGKTTVLREFAGIDLPDYLMINPDEIKKEMALRGLVPEVDGLTPMEATDLVHEEASHLAKRLARMAQADGRNVIWDVTMAKAQSAERRIDALRAGGYTQVDGIFVETPVEVAARRADARHREGHDAYRAGDGLGGRFVAAETIHAQATDGRWGSVNRANFEQIKHSLDAWATYDNSSDDGAPVLVASSGWARDGGRKDP